MKFRFLAAAMLCLITSGCGRKQIQLQEIPVLNYSPPAQGDTIIVMNIRDFGEVRFRLFSDLLPEACENFITLADQGYYDGLTFHRVIQNFMIQGGDPNGDGSGGESCWGGYFNGGISEQLIHLPGALAYANSGNPATDGSQFYIVTGQQVTQPLLDELIENYEMYFSAEATDFYTQYGGAPYLDGSYTVFGQVIDGLDIVFQISRLDTDPHNDMPLHPVYIESVRTEAYDNSQIRWYPSDYNPEPVQ